MTKALVRCTMVYGLLTAAAACSSGPAVRDTGGEMATAGRAGVICTASERLLPVNILQAPAQARRILLIGAELMLDTEEGLFRLRNHGWELVVAGGHAYAVSSDTLIRVVEGKLEIFRYVPGGELQSINSFHLKGNESSSAIVSGEILLHAATNENNYLIERRSLETGAVTGYLLPVGRDFKDLFFNNFERLLDDAGRVHAFGSLLIFAPYTHGPVRLLDLDYGVQYELLTNDRLRGRVVAGTVDTVEYSREQACPTCTVNVTVRAKRNPSIEAVHADAIVMGDAAWVLGHDAPGSTRGVVYRYPIRDGRPGDGMSWHLPAFESRPRSLGIRGDTLYVASESALYWFETPRRNASSECARTI
jgi:hypothetical protein